MPLICFFGPDGSGKSTLAKALAERLNDRGLMVKVSWMRGTHTLASLIARLLSQFKAFRGSDNPYYGITIPRKLKRLWQLLEFASAIPLLLLRFVLLSVLGYWVVAERYVPDFIAWVSLTTNDQRYLESVEAKFLLALSSRVHTKIYVTATLKELSYRRKGTNSRFVGKQLELYYRIASDIDAHRLDTTNTSVSESLEEVLSLLNVA